MDLRQLTVYEQLGWVNMRAIIFQLTVVDHSSSCGLEKFVENIPTRPAVPVYTLNVRPKYIFAIELFSGNPHPRWGCAR